MHAVIMHYHRQGNISHRNISTDVFDIPVSSHLCLISIQRLVPTHRLLIFVGLRTCSKGREKQQVVLAYPRHRGHAKILCHLHCRYPWAILGAGTPASASLSHTRSMAIDESYCHQLSIYYVFTTTDSTSTYWEHPVLLIQKSARLLT